MSNKFKQIIESIIYVIFTNIVFGLIYFFVFSWLVEYSLLFAYFGCLGLIVIGLVLDNIMKKGLASEKTITTIKGLSEKDKIANYRMLKFITDSFVSFKTVLFVFYIFVLIASQVISFNPSLAGEKFSNFVTANSYGLVLVIAFYMIVDQIPKDKLEMKEKAAIIEKAINEEMPKDVNKED